MSNQLTPIALMAKADRACSSARTLLDLGDVDGACNRAYYAMFDAARAALLASGSSVRPNIGNPNENSKTKPPLALVKLFKLLDRHPDLLNTVRAA